MTRELFLAAANGRTSDVKRILESSIVIDVDFRGAGGMTSLHAATQFKHAGVVELLLQHGATKTNAIMSLPRIALTQEVWDLLHPELLTQAAQVQVKIDAYKASHIFDVTIDFLVSLGVQYRKTEKVDVLSKEDVLKYIVRTIEYMTLELLEASKSTDSTADNKAMQMLDVLSACAFLVKTKYTDIVGKLPNIAWENLALYARHAQYNPNFLSGLSVSTTNHFIKQAMHSMLDSGELEQMLVSIQTLSPAVSDLPKMNALLGFINDEYNAQYIESAIRDCRDHCDLTSDFGRVRLLMGLVEIGEALNNASARLQSLFTESFMDQLSIVRNTIAHPERVGNREAIQGFLSGHAATITINGITINLSDLYASIVQSYDSVLVFLDQYDESITVEMLWQEVEGLSCDYILNKKHAMPDSNRDTILSEITRSYMIKLRQIDDQFKDDKKALDDLMIQQFKDKNFTDKVDQKLKNPCKALDDTTEALSKYKNEYELAKVITEDIRTDKQKKLLVDYENTQQKQKLWQDYKTQLQHLEQTRVIEEDKAKQSKLLAIDEFVIQLIDDFIFYSEKTKDLFGELSDFTYVTSTSDNELYRGFASHQDHPLLEFYQIMLGSLARTLIDIDSVKNVISADFKHLLEDQVIVSRGYLAHIGIREIGEAIDVSMDRPDVFSTNAKIVASIMDVQVMRYAIEHHINWQVAQDKVLESQQNVELFSMLLGEDYFTP